MSNKTYNNPWAGLSSYQDPEGSDVQLKFCGRDNESFDVMRLIDDNIFVTLYGKSGTGKTSLLNAGVFPRLRREQYLPVSIRLGMDAIDMSFQQCILTKLDKALEGKGHKETIDVVPMPDDEQSPAYLWSYFARTRFVANDDSTLFPVVVFDQFEEVFRHRRQDAEALLRQIYFMMDENRALSDRMVDGQPYQYDFNFRFVASIREDDLYRLEDSIDNCYLPDMKRCRYRLRSLSEQGARDAVLIPGEGLFRPDEEEGIVRTIMEIARNKDDDSISTNILSLICSRIFVDYQKSGAEFITPALVDTFVKGNPFEQFYNEATRGFSNREKNYIEDHLVDSTGRRNSVPEADFLLHVKNGTVLLEGTQKILQRTSVSSDGSNYRIELIHDSFCEPLEGLKEKRMQRRRIRMSILGIFAVVCIFGAAWTFIDNIKSAQDKARENNILNVVRKSQMYLDQGDSYSARVALLDILPDSAKDCQPVLEAALRAATSQNTTVFMGHTDALNRVRFSKDESKLLTCSYDGTIKLWNKETGECLKTFEGHKDWVFDVYFCKDDKRIVSISQDGTIRLWDIESTKEINRIDSVDMIRLAVSPDQNFVLAGKDNHVQLYDAESFNCIRTFKNSSFWGDFVWHPNGKSFFVYTTDDKICNIDVTSGACHTLSQNMTEAFLINMTINPQGTQIAGAYGYRSSEPGYVKVWDAVNGKELFVLRDIDEWVNGVSYSPDGKILASTSMGGDVRLWNTTNGACIDVMKRHSFASGSPHFNKDGSSFITDSADGTARLWDLSKDDKDVDYLNDRNVYNMFFDQTGNNVIACSKDSSYVYDITNKKVKYNLPKCSVQISKAFFVDNKAIHALASNYKDTIMLLNWQKKQWERKFKGLKATRIAVKSDISTFACLTKDSNLQIYDIPTEKIVKNLGKQHGFISMCFSPDGKLFAEACSDSLVKIWDTERWICKQTINTHHDTENSYFMQISNDNNYLLRGKGNKLVVWNINSGKYEKSFEGHRSNIYGCSLSADDKYLVTVSHDILVKIWDFESTTCIQTFKITQYGYAAFSPNGSHICLWRLRFNPGILTFRPLQELIDETHERFMNRKLSEDERRKYYLE